MPAGYEALVKKFMREGLSEKEAKKKAAKIWNKNHPDDPVYPRRD